jgi:hypothetical protein
MWAVRLPIVKQARRLATSARLWPRLPERAGRARGMLSWVERCLSVLITQRSQVQILPPLPGSAGQRPDRQDGGQALIFVAAWWQQDLGAQGGQEYKELAETGIGGGQIGTRLGAARNVRTGH